MMWGNGFGWNGMGWGGMIFGSFFMLAFLGGLIVLGFFAVRALVQTGSVQNQTTLPNSTRALDILKERYARGEITKDEYDNMRRDLAS